MLSSCFNARPTRHTTSAVLFTALISGQALGEDKKLIFNTFGTVGYAIMTKSEGGEEFNTDTYGYVPKESKSYWGITKTGTFDRDTRFGLNLSAPLTDNIDFTAQIYTEAANTTTGLPEYFAAKFTVMSLLLEPYRDLFVRLGLFQVPLWLISEEKYVGYTYPYIRNPAEVQGILFAGDTMRGISAAYSFNFGDLVVTPRTTYGTYVNYESITPTIDLPTDASIMINNLSLEYENILFKAGYHFFKGQADQVIGQKVTSNGIDTQATLLSSLYYTGTNLGLGMKAEFKHVMFMAEYNQHESDWKSVSGFLAPLKGSKQKITGAYGLIGFPLGKWMPRAHYAWFNKVVEAPDDAVERFIDIFINQSPSISDNMKPIARQGVRAKGKTLLYDLYESRIEQRTINFGLNYQWSINVVVKVEAERVEAPDTVSVGQFGLKRGSKVETVSTAVDFVY